MGSRMWMLGVRRGGCQLCPAVSVCVLLLDACVRSHPTGALQLDVEFFPLCVLRGRLSRFRWVSVASGMEPEVICGCHGVLSGPQEAAHCRRERPGVGGPVARGVSGLRCFTRGFFSLCSPVGRVLLGGAEPRFQGGFFNCHCCGCAGIVDHWLSLLLCRCSTEKVGPLALLFLRRPWAARCPCPQTVSLGSFLVRSFGGMD